MYYSYLVNDERELVAPEVWNYYDYYDDYYDEYYWDEDEYWDYYDEDYLRFNYGFE